MIRLGVGFTLISGVRRPLSSCSVRAKAVSWLQGRGRLRARVGAGAGVGVGVGVRVGVGLVRIRG